MPAFRLTPGIRTRDPGSLIKPFLEIVGYDALKRRAEKLFGRMEADPHARILLPQRHELELISWQTVAHYETYATIPDLLLPGRYLNASLYRGLNFIDMLTDVHPRLSPIGQRRLKGRIKQAFKDEDGLLSVAQEMDVINFLTQAGCTITCNDLEGAAGGADFVAERQGIEFEVECKAISPDKGRPIHQYDALALIERITPLLDSHCVVASNEGAFISLRIPDRLSRRPQELDDIADQVRRTLEEKRSISGILCDTEFRTFRIANSPFAADVPRDDRKRAAYIENITGIPNGRMLTKAIPGHAAIVVSLESRKPYLVSIHGERAARQTADFEFCSPLDAAEHGQVFAPAKPAFLPLRGLPRVARPWRSDSQGCSDPVARAEHRRERSQPEGAKVGYRARTIGIGVP